MNKQLRLILCLLLPAFLISCGKESGDELLKTWKATELTLGETALSADDLGGVYLGYKKDGSFFYTESGKTEDGTWTLSDDQKTITLKFEESDRTVQQQIKELSAEKLVIEYEEHDMKRTISLVPDKE
jgi:hypothetical protein